MAKAAPFFSWVVVCLLLVLFVVSSAGRGLTATYPEESPEEAFAPLAAEGPAEAPGAVEDMLDMLL